MDSMLISQEQDFPRWYQDVIAKAQLAENDPEPPFAAHRLALAYHSQIHWRHEQCCAHDWGARSA